MSHLDPSLSDVSALDLLDRQDRSGQNLINDELIRRSVATTILHYVENPEVEEVFINRPHEIWLKLRRRNRHGLFWERNYAPDLSYQRLVSDFHYLANAAATDRFGPDYNPVTNGTLPGGHRYIAAYGMNFQYDDKIADPAGTVLLACRQNTQDVDRDFDSWGLKRGRPLPDWNPEEARRADSSDPINKIIAIIKRGEHILLSGETGVGKTSFIMRLLRMLPAHARICTVQDTLELKIPQKNKFHVLMNRQGSSNNFGYGSVIDMIVRMNTDTVLFGEVSSLNAPSIIEAASTGNACFMATIHAHSSEEAIEAYTQRYAHSRNIDDAARANIAASIRKKFHIIQLNHDKSTNERQVVEIT